MKTKICTKCGKEKPIEKFKKFKSTNGKYYYTGDCKQCRNLYAYERNKRYRLSHKKEIAIMKKINYQKNKDIIKEKHKQYYLNNRISIIKTTREWYSINKEKIREKKHKYYQEHKKQLLKEKYEYKKRRLKNDNIYKIKEQVRNMIRTSFRKNGMLKSEKTEKILGCNLNYFYDYLLKTFKETYGYEYDFSEKVHIDHIKPLYSAKTKEEVIKLCYYTNLQLLKEKDNILKSNNLNWKIKNK